MIVCAVTSENISIRVLTYNIRAADYGLKNIISTLKNADADIIALQEVDKLVKRTGRVNQPKRIAKALGMYYTFRKHFRYQGGEFGLALFSRYKIDRVERITVKESNLTILKARVNTPKQPIGVVVVHFHPTNPLENKSTREVNTRARHREAKKAFDIAKSFGYPTLIMGDFNDTPGSIPYELFASKFQDASQVVGNSRSKTWPSFFPLTQIDYIWTSKTIHVLNCRTIESRASDHVPIVADIQIGNASK